MIACFFPMIDSSILFIPVGSCSNTFFIDCITFAKLCLSIFSLTYLNVCADAPSFQSAASLASSSSGFIFATDFFFILGFLSNDLIASFTLSVSSLSANKPFNIFSCNIARASGDIPDNRCFISDTFFTPATYSFFALFAASFSTSMEPTSLFNTFINCLKFSCSSIGSSDKSFLKLSDILSL